jgi:hypothetical protein
MKPKWRRAAALVLVVITLIGWPLSALTWARDEPQFVLGLSWLAITLTAVDIASTTDVRVEQDDDPDSA